ncbi:MAG: hypothetical protein KGH78_03905 [Candidatus Micrarchaeota archaeon]|nr:hypothetical protein [Candidatus Micrarchaeota archaeon]
MDNKLVAESAAGGIVITLLSYFYNGTPHLVGATWYGFPLTWIRYLVVGPQYNPWAVDFLGLIVDIIVWSVVVAAVLILIGRKKRGK